jgi:hypothetical protein
MKRQGIGPAFLLVAAGILCGAPEASAKIILITHGDTISHVGEISPNLQAQVQQNLKKSGLKVGFHYSYFGVFWLDLWTWGGEYCVYDGQGYAPISPDQAAFFLGKSESDLSKPFNYKFPIGLDILAGLAVIGIIAGIMNKRSQRKTQALFDDPRYRKAMDIFTEHADKEAAAPPPEGTAPGRAGFEAAVRYLETEGIPPQEAEKNLLRIMQTLHAAGAASGASGPPPGPAGDIQVGQILQVRLDRPGDQPGQAVGQLADGSKVIVPDGQALIGQETLLEVVRVEQTPEGRMILGKATKWPAGPAEV